jgi:phage gpG-like protein
MNASDFFRKLKANLPRLQDRILNDVIAVEAEAFHAKNFRDEGFTDTGLQKWPARKKSDKNPARRALLVLTGNLKGHALKGRVQGSSVVFSFPLEYMRVHNEGGRVGRGAGFDMPMRKYIGESEYLRKRIEDKARRLMDQTLKSL